MGFKKGQLKKRLGAIPSEWKNTHYRLSLATLADALQLPNRYRGLDQYMPSPFPDQEDIGTCVGWCGSNVMEITNRLEDKVPVNISAGWLYSKSRKYGNIPAHIEGSTNLGLMKALNKEGATTEECAPTDLVPPFQITPCEGAVDENSIHYAGNYAIDSYWSITNTPLDIKAAIYGITHKANYLMPDGSAGKAPLVSAFPVYESFYDGISDGMIPLPQTGEKLLGGHSSMISGWDIINEKEYAVNPGSWGDEVGDNGIFYIPMDYPFYANDFWLIHNGPPTHKPTPIESDCVIGKTLAGVGNIPLRALRRRGRFKYINQ